jgi:hypothetical protein
MFVRHLLNLQPFFETPGGGSGGGSADLDDSTELDLQQLEDDGEADEGKEDEDSEEDEGEGRKAADEGGEEDESGEEDEVDGEEEDKEGEEEEGEEGKKKELELDASGRPTVKSLKALYPDLFKKVPYLRTAFFEYPKYAEIFSDPESAAAAADKAREYDELEGSLVGQGDPKVLIETLNENNPRALAKIVDSLPEVIRAADPDLYKKLALPFVEELLYIASNHAKRLGADKNQPGRNLFLAASHLANFVFANGGEIPDISKRGARRQAEPSDAERQLEEERHAYRTEKYRDAMGDTEGRIDTEFIKILSNKLDDLTAFEKRAVIRDARREVDQALTRDKGFQRQMAGLWKRAAEDNYSESSKTKIRRVWLERARAIAPGIRNRLRQEALDARTPGKGDSDKGKKRQFAGKGGQAPKGSSRVADPKKIDWRKTSDMDILNS